MPLCISSSEGEINLCRRGSTYFARYTTYVTDGAKELQANMEMKRIRTGSPWLCNACLLARSKNAMNDTWAYGIINTRVKLTASLSHRGTLLFSTTNCYAI